MRRIAFQIAVLTGLSGLLACGGPETAPRAPAAKTQDAPAQPRGAKPTPDSLTGSPTPLENLAKTPAPPRSEAELRVRLCAAGLFVFYQHLGRLPTAEEGLTVLFQAPADERDQERWLGPYVEKRWTVDPWSRDIELIASPGRPMGIDIRSLGPDGLPSEDDILALDHQELHEAFAVVEQGGLPVTQGPATGEAPQSEPPAPVTLPRVP